MIERNPIIQDGLNLASKSPDKGGYQVLIVDSDTELLNLLAEFLSKEGYEVFTCSDIVAALEMLANRNINLIIGSADISDSNGFELLESVKSNPEWQSIPFFYLSAQDDPSERVNALRAGADDYLIKPFNPQELLIRIKRSLKDNSDLGKKDLVGKIKKNSVPEILQYFANTHMTGHLTLECGPEKGQLWFKDGELVRAECGGKRGEEAVYQVMTFDSGQFYFENKDIDFEPEIKNSLLAILLEGLRILDEKKAGVFPSDRSDPFDESDANIETFELQLTDGDEGIEFMDGEGQEGVNNMSKADELIAELCQLNEVKDGMVMTTEGAIISENISDTMKKWADLMKYFAMSSLQVKPILGLPQPWYVQIDSEEGHKILIIIVEGYFVVLLLSSMSVPAQLYPELVNIITNHSLIKG